MDMTLLLMAAVLVALIAYQFYAAKRRKAQAEDRVATIVPGVEVLTHSGMYGKLISIDTDDNVAMLEIAPKVIIKLHTQAIRQAVPVFEETAEDADGPELNTSSATPMAESDAEIGDRAKKSPRKKPSSDSQ